jgi:hypothetical protein
MIARALVTRTTTRLVVNKNASTSRMPRRRGRLRSRYRCRTLPASMTKSTLSVALVMIATRTIRTRRQAAAGLAKRTDESPERSVEAAN